MGLDGHVSLTSLHAPAGSTEAWSNGEVTQGSATPGGDALVVGVLEPREHDFRLISVSGATEQFCGLAADRLPGRRLSELGVAPASIEVWREHCEQSARTGGPIRFAYTSALTGEARRLVATVFPVEASNRAAPQFGFMVEDRTREHEAEAERCAQYEFTRQVIELMGQGLTVTNAAGRFVYVNHAYARLVGLDPSMMVGHSPFDFTFAEDHQTLMAARQQRAAGQTTSYQTRLRHVDGSAVHAYITGVPRVEAGATAGAISVITDLTERVHMENALRASERRYRDLVEMSQGLICTHDLDGVLLSVNPAAAKALGFEPGELVGAPLVNFLAPDVHPDFQGYLQRIRRRPAVTGSMRVRTRSGVERIWQYHNVRYDEPGQAAYVVGHAHDVTERYLRENSLRRQAERDSLTGLPNRRHFDAHLARALRQMRADGQRLAVLYIDLDGFKQINDRLGHQAGDHLLRQIAARLRAAVRARDIVARFGGDEFVILASDIDREKSAQIAKRLVARLQDPICLGENGSVDRAAISTSIGIALGPDHGGVAAALLRRADAAMYHAKRFRLGVAFADDWISALGVQ